MTVRVTLAHGVLQRIADDVGVRLLHIKGTAVADDLLDTHPGTDADGHEITVRRPRGSSDADVLVDPTQIKVYLAALKQHGWTRKTNFYTGSAFGHALNVYHPRLGNADIHRRYPGLPDETFDALWEQRQTKLLGHVSCPVPALPAQRLILLLHAARSGKGHPDVARAWGRATDDERRHVRLLASALDAELGLAAALGELDGWQHHPEYLLWKHFSEGDPLRLHEWRARWRAATTLRGKARVVRSFLLYDPAFLESGLGHAPTRRQILDRNLARFDTMYRELRELAGRKRR